MNSFPAFFSQLNLAAALALSLAFISPVRCTHAEIFDTVGC